MAETEEEWTWYAGSNDEYQANDLEAYITEAIDAWQEDHELVFLPQLFTAVRNEEYVSRQRLPPQREPENV